MKQGWFERNFGWIGDDFGRLWTQLQKRDTWIFLGIAAIFAVLVYYGFELAIKIDFTMRLRNLSGSACREIDNSATTFLFFAMIFLALTITMVFGEFARYQDYKRRNAPALARGAANHCAGWGAFALFIGLAMVFFLHYQCS